MREGNGSGLPDSHDTDPPMADLQTQVVYLRRDLDDTRAEMRMGFAGVHNAIETLRRSDVKQDLQIGALAKKYGSIAAVIVSGGVAGDLIVRWVARLISGQ